MPPFDYRTLGQYEPVRSDCPGDVPAMPISDVAEDDPEYGQTPEDWCEEMNEDDEEVIRITTVLPEVSTEWSRGVY